VTCRSPEDDLATIEARMKEIVARDLPIERMDLKKPDAIAFFEKEAEPYKLYFATTKGDDVVSIYRQGGWTDFCRGPHVPSTGRPGRVQAPLGCRRVLAG
jgi:threonyl-tRNA synthetase